MKTGTKQLTLRFKALADPVRLRLVALCRAAECSVSELTQVTSLSQPRISQHLKTLVDADILERFRDGHFVYYRVATEGSDAQARRRLLAMLPADEPQFDKDLEKLCVLRADDDTGRTAVSDGDRSLHRALVELTVAMPLGDLLDVGSGQGRILKLLASRAKRAVGVDVDADQRRLARTELLLAGLPNCSLRNGNMYDLPFDDAEFDTIVLDDVLLDAERPHAVLIEARRLLRDGGRLLLLASLAANDGADVRRQFASWASKVNLRLAPARAIPSKNPDWLLAVATAANDAAAAA